MSQASTLLSRVYNDVLKLASKGFRSAHADIAAKEGSLASRVSFFGRHLPQEGRPPGFLAFRAAPLP
jgi:hypothetical protein